MTATRYTKKSIGLKSEKKTDFARTAHVFVHFFAIDFHDFNVPETSYLHVLWRKNRICSYIRSPILPTFHFFFISLLLILTLLAANICHFSHSQLWIFHVFFFRNELRLVSFFFFFWNVFRSSSFSVIGVSVVVVGGNSRTHDHVIIKFSRIYRLPFFLSHARKLR